MVTYELIKKIENDSDFILLLQKGIIPLSILNKKCYYEKYLQQLNDCSNLQAIRKTADNYNVSEMTIRRAIDFMVG